MPQLTLKQANAIIEKGFAKAREMKIKPLGIVVLDDSGHIISAQREDGASMFRLDVAKGKAWAAVAMGMSSRDLAARAQDNPNFFVSLAATGQGRFLPQPGAVLIHDREGNVLGAAGASGGTGDQDEQVCRSAVETAGFSVEG